MMDINEALKMTIEQVLDDNLKGHARDVLAGDETTKDAYECYTGFSLNIEHFLERLQSNATGIIDPKIIDDMTDVTNEVWLNHSELVR